MKLTFSLFLICLGFNLYAEIYYKEVNDSAYFFNPLLFDFDADSTIDCSFDVAKFSEENFSYFGTRTTNSISNTEFDIVYRYPVGIGVLANLNETELVGSNNL